MTEHQSCVSVPSMPTALSITEKWQSSSGIAGGPSVRCWNVQCCGQSLQVESTGRATEARHLLGSERSSLHMQAAALSRRAAQKALIG